MQSSFFRFGSYTFQIELCEAFSSYSFEHWKDYRVSSIPSNVYTLFVTLTTLPRIREITSGWFFDKCADRNHLTYYNASIPLFSLEYGKNIDKITIQVANKDERSLLLGIQFAMLLVLAPHAIGLHGVTTICKNRVVILSAPSGTGKTTLSNLLQRHCKAAVINGDFALLSFHNKLGVLYHPTPFCGTSGITHNHTLPVSHIVFLEQGNKNCYTSLNSRQALVHLMSNSFIPHWDEEIFVQLQSILMDIVEHVTVGLYTFLPERHAAEILHEIVTM